MSYAFSPGSSPRLSIQMGFCDWSIHPSDPMDAKKKDTIITAIVVAIVIAQMAAIAISVYLSNTGAISQETLLIFSSMISSGMFVVIIIYALYINKARPNEAFEEYRQSVEGKDKDGKE